MNHSRRHVVRDIVVSGVLLLGCAGLLVLREKDFKDTFQILADAPLGLLLLGVALVLATYVVAALSYMALSVDKRLRFGRTFSIQIASGITNRLLPAGLGGAGLYALYLKRSGFRLTQATAIVATNNILGAIGNFVLLVIALVLAPKASFMWKLPSRSLTYAAVGCAVLFVLVVLLARHGKWLDRAREFLHDTLRSLRLALKPGKRTAGSLAANMILTALNGLILCVTVIAAGGHMYWPLTIAVLSVGALLGAAVPTPGGLGGTEAGILAGLVACGVAAAPALAATLLFRGLTYWLPIIPGLLMLPLIRRRYLP